MLKTVSNQPKVVEISPNPPFFPYKQLKGRTNSTKPLQELIFRASCVCLGLRVVERSHGTIRDYRVKEDALIHYERTNDRK